MLTLSDTVVKTNSLLFRSKHLKQLRKFQYREVQYFNYCKSSIKPPGAYLILDTPEGDY